MDAFANTLKIALPMFFILIVIEAIVDRVKGKKKVKAFDTISSLSSGVTNLIKDSVGLVVVIISYPYLVNKLGLFSYEDTWVVYLVGFIALDFAGYANHVLAHQINYFWNNHRIHHSSEEFNLPCALRQSIATFFGTFVIFLIPAAFLGVPHEVIGAIAPAHLFLQFWYHTQYIPKLGILEYIIVTPSQHRVHHAINDIYINKNLGQIFCIWDRMFGTFQEELDDVPPAYGVLAPARTWNPIKINFQHLWLLAKDAWRTNNWWDKLRLWFMPTGWRPDDVKDKYPITKINDVYNFDKYETPFSKSLVAWSWFHYTINSLLAVIMLFQIKAIGFPAIFVFSAVLMMSIYAYTSLMDGERVAFWISILTGIFAIGIVIYSGSFFGIDSLIPNGSVIVLSYFVAAPVGAYWFLNNWGEEEQELQSVA